MSRNMGERTHRRHVLLAGGGSGGHVFPALAVAAELASRGSRVSFLGSEGGLEREVVPRHGYSFHGLPARPFVGRGPLRQAAALVTLGRSSLRARGLVRRGGIEVALGTGGYASAAGLLGTRLARRPALLLEPNATAGTANRWLSRWLQGAAVGYSSAAGGLRCPVWVTGVPVRAEFFRVSDREPQAPPYRLLVLGGSQGATELNRLLPAAAARLAGDGVELDIVHQAGRGKAAATREDYREAIERGAAVEVEEFLTDVAGALERCHAVVSRAGAVTLAEIFAAGRPALLVPLALAGGHQLSNARAAERLGAARVVPGGEASAARLAQQLTELLGGPEARREMGRRGRAAARPDAAARIADRIEEVATGV